MNKESSISNAVSYGSFFKVPRCIFTNKKYNFLSDSAKFLYMLMCDRADVSIKNNWLDDEGNVYIYYTVLNVCESLNCCREKAVSILKELDENGGVGLISRKKQGLGKPDIIYVKYPVEEEITKSYPNAKEENGEIFLPEKAVGKTEPQCFEKQNFGVSENRTQEVGKTEPNHNNINYNNISYNKYNHICLKEQENEPGTEAMASIYKKIVKSNIEYDCFEKSPKLMRFVDNIVEIMTDVLSTSGKTFYIGNIGYSHEAVKERFLELKNEHIQYVYDVFQKSKPKLRKVKEYIISTLYRAPETMEIWYSSQ